MNTKDLPSLLRKIREAAGLSQMEVGRRLGDKDGKKGKSVWINAIEKGKIAPGDDLLMKLFEVYSLSVREQLEVYNAVGRLHPVVIEYLLNNPRQLINLMGRACKNANIKR